MSKRPAYTVQTGQLEGAKLKIEAVHNNGLQESVSVINRGSVGQPLSGWVIASLRGQVYFVFPDDLQLEPYMIVAIRSGQPVKNKICEGPSVRADLLWTTDQVWNNHGDIAILFDANGFEIDRYSYPHARVLGSSAIRRKVLIRNDGGFEIVNESLRREKKITRKQNRAMEPQL